MEQNIIPRASIFSCGDSVTFRLKSTALEIGDAYLRTNLGRVGTRRTEIIDCTEKNEPILTKDWYDLPMISSGHGEWKIILPLLEVGLFEAKCWFQNKKDGKQIWSRGKNFKLKVEPPHNICGNSIYTVFPRQFGRDLYKDVASKQEKQSCATLDAAGYTVIPPSGTFREVIKRLDFIIGKLHSRIIQLLPIHPVPTVYGRMGRYGSPFASLDYFGVDSSLAEFDLTTTPLEQFLELVDAVHARHAQVFLDIPVNHTGWASRLQSEHPEWFVRRKDGTFVSPGAWDVVWADLCKLDYKRSEVHALMADIFLHWARLGVDGFRCDAGYMLPLEAWKYIVAKVRQEYPNTIFLLEGLGGPGDVQERLLDEAGLNWAYSELFQNQSKTSIDHYYPHAARMSDSKGCYVSYAETHDNDRLAAESTTFAKMRTCLCALFAHNGAFGITNGVEWFADQKIDVHGAGSLKWGNQENQVELIRTLQTLLEVHPCFFAGASTELVHVGNTNGLALLRRDADKTKELLILINLSTEAETTLTWVCNDFAVKDDALDLLSGDAVKITAKDNLQKMQLKAGAAICISNDVSDWRLLEEALFSRELEPRIIREQREKLELLKLNSFFNGYGDVSKFAKKELQKSMLHDPVQLCAKLSGLKIPPLTSWTEGVDPKRVVMIPSGDLLLVKSQWPFKVEIKDGERTKAVAKSLTQADGQCFAFLRGFDNTSEKSVKLKLKLRLFRHNKVESQYGELNLLPQFDQVYFENTFTKQQVRERNLYALCSNKLGGMSQVRAKWGRISSKYDAILAANLNKNYPVDRHVLFTRCRAWVVCREFSRELNEFCLDHFKAGSGNAASWSFNVPVGQGKVVPLKITLQMAHDCNAVKLLFERQIPSTDSLSALGNDVPIQLILRPDIEDRVNHEVTKAMDGPEYSFINAISNTSRGFDFDPGKGRHLKLRTDRGVFVPQSEWQYMVELPVEAERGMCNHTDLFSPGYFKFKLLAGESTTLQALGDSSGKASMQQLDSCKWGIADIPDALQPHSAMLRGLRHFVTKRDDFHTVIAGYPWFLDWGRDTLIALRGMIAAGYKSEAKDIIMQFCKFEKAGTIPNVLRGIDDSNRETSDAPLWLIVAIADYCKNVNNYDLLQECCGERQILEILESIISHYSTGTPTGIVTDKQSGLVFSPSHFTWMDTNYPAGSPRQGYPVEIQALWIYSLSFVSMFKEKWKPLNRLARESFLELFWDSKRGYLCDCLEGESGMSASMAHKSGACRPNQLLAITLGCIDDEAIIKAVIHSCEALLVPGAIRSLADSPVSPEMPIWSNGSLLNDPKHPFWGKYRGDEDTRRKPAYHNGTAWTWPFPSYFEALTLLEKDRGACKRALALLLSCKELFEQGTPGQLPEIVDGAAPHTWRGCGAQAWGISEAYRVYKLLLDRLS